MFDLEKPFTADTAVKEEDARAMKTALNHLGYYAPNPKLGITALPDRAVFTALKAFQKENGLQVTATAKPHDKTVEALNAETEKQDSSNGQYIWHTVQDDHVRSSHRQREGQTFSWNAPPEGGHPCEDYNCRCWAEPITDAITPVYPELFLLPLFRFSRIANLWRIWALRGYRNTDWTLGKFKSQKRWENQLQKRNWTPEKITETIKHGKKYPAPNKVHPENEAARYEYKGNYVVRDEVTNEILQIGEPSFDRSMIYGE